MTLGGDTLHCGQLGGGKHYIIGGQGKNITALGHKSFRWQTPHFWTTTHTALQASFISLDNFIQILNILDQFQLSASTFAPSSYSNNQSMVQSLLLVENSWAKILTRQCFNPRYFDDDQWLMSILCLTFPGITTFPILRHTTTLTIFKVKL